jgi:hypothetical protein
MSAKKTTKKSSGSRAVPSHPTWIEMIIVCTRSCCFSARSLWSAVLPLGHVCSSIREFLVVVIRHGDYDTTVTRPSGRSFLHRIRLASGMLSVPSVLTHVNRSVSPLTQTRLAQAFPVLRSRSQCLGDSRVYPTTKGLPPTSQIRREPVSH